MIKQLALHETLELHELMTFKTLCVTKATTMSGLAQDIELQTILTNDATAGNDALKRMQQFITKRGDESI
ncbi:hypothetical protein OEV98_16090 [Caldibacillus lycopersici]|uniref:Spore coat protein n=1 Tax=Perspicuibacillus lycopersici TaxID=1325689 RepID=A0AAE3LPK2_9BACI|nr:hypothetical protein [Perspicuibacillus lycopersici]MCU9615056.1 hypothetical protein [Perspicuibacillus lycopersici]